MTKRLPRLKRILELSMNGLISVRVVLWSGKLWVQEWDFEVNEWRTDRDYAHENILIASSRAVALFYRSIYSLQNEPIDIEVIEFFKRKSDGLPDPND